MVTENSVPARATEADDPIPKAIDVMSHLADENERLQLELYRATKREEELYRRVMTLEDSVAGLSAQNQRWQESKLMRVQRSYWQLRGRLAKRSRSTSPTSD